MAYRFVTRRYLDVTVIETQKKDAVNALTNQHKLQADMLEHQYKAQTDMLKAEFTRNVTMATQQFEQQMLQQTMSLEQQYSCSSYLKVQTNVETFISGRVFQKGEICFQNRARF